MPNMRSDLLPAVRFMHVKRNHELITRAIGRFLAGTKLIDICFFQCVFVSGSQDFDWRLVDGRCSSLIRRTSLQGQELKFDRYMPYVVSGEVWTMILAKQVFMAVFYRACCSGHGTYRREIANRPGRRHEESAGPDCGISLFGSRELDISRLSLRFFL